MLIIITTHTPKHDFSNIYKCVLADYDIQYIIYIYIKYGEIFFQQIKSLNKK